VTLTASILSAAQQAPADGTATIRIRALSYLEDTTAEWTLDDVLKVDSNQFVATSDRNVRLGLTKNPFWFRIDVVDSTVAVDAILELNNPRLGEVFLYAPDELGAYTEQATGVRRPFWERTIPSLTPAFSIHLPEGATQPLYLLVKNSGSMGFEARLWSPEAFKRHMSYSLAFAAVIAAGLIIMALHKFLIYLHLREPGYLWIALFLLTCSLRQMTASAMANMFLWPDSPLWARHAMDVTTMATMLTGIFMANNLLEIWQRSPRWAALNIALGILAVLAGLLSLTGLSLSLLLMLATSMAIPFSVTAYTLWEIAKGSGAARWFLASWGTVIIGALATSLVASGVLPSNLVTEHFLDIALLGAGLSWSFTLTHQVKIRQEDQRNLLEAQVRERTAALEEALEAVRTLRGLVPICSCCKKIRNDDGFWEILESYLRNHTEADFSHGLCPDCAKANYPEYYRDKSSGEEGKRPQ